MMTANDVAYSCKCLYPVIRDVCIKISNQKQLRVENRNDNVFDANKTKHCMEFEMNRSCGLYAVTSSFLSIFNEVDI